MVKVRNLVGELSEHEGERLRYVGYERSRELLELHRAKLERLALALVEHLELDQAIIEQIMSLSNE